MAERILLGHIEPAAPVLHHDGVEVSQTWRTDVFTGTPQALMSAGVITAAQLEPQHFRGERKAAYLPSGEPCPRHVRAWRQPGYKSVFQTTLGTCVVEITVSKTEQAARRRAARIASAEADEVRINQELAERGATVIPQTLVHEFERDFESWTGTKQQLQAAGFAVGKAFPGEPGAHKVLNCACKLGFPVRISRHYDLVEAAAGVFRATSDYLPARAHVGLPSYVEHAPGVLVALGGSPRRDTFRGSAAALVAAQIVPTMHHFPDSSQVQCSFGPDGNKTRRSRKGRITVRRLSSDSFEVSRAVGADEVEKRTALWHEEREAARDATEKARQERRRLRGLLSLGDDASEETFRNVRLDRVEMGIRLVWDFLCGSDGLHSLAIGEDTEAYDELAVAFQTIRDVVRSAEILTDGAVLAEVAELRGATQAKQDKGLQTFLRLVVNNGTRP